MADTIPNITIGVDEWVDVYTETSITPTSDISICNLGNYFLIYQENATQPNGDDDNGQLIGDVTSGNYQAIVTSVSTKVWLKSQSGSNPVNIQQI